VSRDEGGVCGHALNELRTSYELKERGRKRRMRRQNEAREATLWNTCVTPVIFGPGRGQSSLPAVTSLIQLQGLLRKGHFMRQYVCFWLSLSVISVTNRLLFLSSKAFHC